MKTTLLALLALLPSLPCAAAQMDDQPVEKHVITVEKPHNSLPTLWIIGDSTVRVGTPGEKGWGDALGPFFDTAKINLVNRAIGGRSSRTFYTEGRWDDVLKQLRAGDIVIMQFGHNDASPVDEKPPVTKNTRCRGTLKGNGEETQKVFNILTNKDEVVHTYGWYLRDFITTAKAKGAKAIVCSPIPRKSWAKDGDTINRNNTNYGLWAKQAAEQAGAQFIDLNDIIARQYEQIAAKNGRSAVDPLFGDKGTHTSPAGASLNARCVVSGLNGLAPNPLAFALSADGKSVPPPTAKE